MTRWKYRQPPLNRTTLTGYTAQGREAYHTAPGVTPSTPVLELDSLQHPRQQDMETPSGSVSWQERGKPAQWGQRPLPPAAPPWRASPVRAGAPPVKHLPKSPHWETPAACELIPSDLLPHRITMTATEPRLIHRGEHRQGQPLSSRDVELHARGTRAPETLSQVFHAEADVLTWASASLGSPWKRRRGHKPARFREPTCSEAQPRAQPSCRPPGAPPPTSGRGRADAAKQAGAA